MRKRNNVTRAASLAPVATGLARSSSRCRAPETLVTLFRFLLYLLPLVLCFSYFPLISFGSNETMNFELSLPLIWLVLFDILSFVIICKKYRKQLFSKVFGSILWWLFPIFVTISVCWSLNPLRGFLTVGVMWLLFFAVISFYELRENLGASFWKVFWRWFFGSFLFVCAWCVIQCILDINGVPQANSLLCDGCVYRMFGFPHPNGFSIEPQFMGNLLIAPILVIAADFCQSSGRVARSYRHRARALVLALPRFGFPRTWQKLSPLLLAVFSVTLFLTFSRGAIYATIVGLIFLFSFAVARAKKPDVKKVFLNTLKTLGVFVLSFAFALNLQGMFAAVSPTSDTYADGVAKVLNHLSLGVINVKGEKSGKTEGNSEPVENSLEVVENSEVVESNSEVKTEAIFDGYVAESTDTRVRLTSAAFEIWRKDFKTAAIGVGIGGAGQALYNNGLSPAPKEIVQNEYASLFLETGVVGVSLFVLIVVLAVKMAFKNRLMAGVVLGLMVAYGVTLFFFSGLSNALQIVLLPGLLLMCGWEKNDV